MTVREDYTTKARVEDDLTLVPSDERTTRRLDTSLDAAHGAVDGHCHRVFTRTASAEARTFALDDASPILWTGDMATAPTMVEVRTSAGGAWTELPATAWAVREPAKPGHPYQAIARLGANWPAELFATVRVTAVWGWAAVPASVEQATRLLAVRYVARPKMAIMRSTPTDELLLYDPDVRHLLRPFVLGWS